MIEVHVKVTGKKEPFQKSSTKTLNKLFTLAKKRTNRLSHELIQLLFFFLINSFDTVRLDYGFVEFRNFHKSSIDGYYVSMKVMIHINC